MKKPIITKSLALLAPSLLFLSACSSDDNNDIVNKPPNEQPPIVEPPTATLAINTAVTAADGGTFTSADGNVRVTIPANALSEDTTLTLTAVDTPNASANIELIGPAYDISIGDATLTDNIAIEIDISDEPVHPQLAEVAALQDGVLSATSGNFYRSSSNTILNLTKTMGVIAPVFRTLQSENSDGVTRGKEVFLNETFGNEAFFSDVVGLHLALNDITPSQAVAVGAQVDVTRVPQGIVDVLQGDDFAAKQAALEDPAVTRALLTAGAVVGLKVTANDDGELTSAGITCALCHGVVEANEFEITGPGETVTLPIGVPRLDGTPNIQSNVGAVLALTPFAVNAGQDTVDFLNSFGPGGFDPRALPDNALEDNILNPTSIPPLWNFIDLDKQGYSYNWDGQFAGGDNAIASRDEAVYDLVMHVNGAFATPAGNVPPALSAAPSQELVDSLGAAESNAPGNDIVTQGLLDLQSWERSLISPKPTDYDEALAEAGFKLFYGAADCTRCHSSPEFTGEGLFTNIVISPPQGGLSGGIKVPGLRGVSKTAPFFHDNSAETMLNVMQIYSGRVVPTLSNDQMLALVEYMNSL